MSARPAHPFGTSEGLALEFKRATDRLRANFFETVCAFLNMDGDLIVLGVEDNGAISGVDPGAVQRIKNDIANLSNNPQKLDPPHLLFPHEEEIDGKWIIKVQVPASSQVHETGGAVFLRSEDGDYRIKGVNRLAGLMNRKLSFFTEQRVYPYLGLADLDPGLFEKARRLMLARTRWSWGWSTAPTRFEKARRLMLARTPKHPWADLNPEALLKVAGFVRPDYATGKLGYTLAAGLMFGYDTTITSLAPGYKFDALLRRRDTERYDDRLIVRTNLIDAFDELMGFVEKHLNDPFYLEGVHSVSLRSVIFRELVANIIAHREYTSAAPATMVIYADRVEFRNPNVPHHHGRIDPDRFTPYPKNPTICRFMLQMGRYEELGSGVRRVNQYLPHYAPGAGRPVFEDGEMFTVTVPIAAGGDVTPQVTPQVEKVLQAVRGEIPRGELMAAVGIKDRMHFVREYLAPAIEAGLVEMTLPDKPNSRLQKYRLTDRGREVLRLLREVVK